MAWLAVQTLSLRENWVFTNQVFPEEIIRFTAIHPPERYLIKLYICQAFPGNPAQIWDVKRLYLTNEKQIIKMEPIPEITSLRTIGVRGVTRDNAYEPNGYKIAIEKWTA